MVRGGQTLDFDMGEITVRQRKVRVLHHGGAGYDATIMRGAQRGKRLLGPSRTCSRPVMNAMPQQSKFTLDLDGRTVESEGLGVLLVNFSKIQFDITVTHENEPRDGEFDVVVLKAKTAFDLIPAVFAGILDRDGEFPDRTDALEIFRAKEVAVSADPPMEVQYDGEAQGLPRRFPRASCPAPRACSSPMKATANSRSRRDGLSGHKQRAQQNALAPILSARRFCIARRRQRASSSHRLRNLR